MNIIQNMIYICICYHESHKEIATCNNKQGAKTISQILWKKCCHPTLFSVCFSSWALL